MTEKPKLDFSASATVLSGRLHILLQPSFFGLLSQGIVVQSPFKFMIKSKLISWRALASSIFLFSPCVACRFQVPPKVHSGPRSLSRRTWSRRRWGWKMWPLTGRWRGHPRLQTPRSCSGSDWMAEEESRGAGGVCQVVDTVVEQALAAIDTMKWLEHSVPEESRHRPKQGCQFLDSSRGTSSWTRQSLGRLLLVRYYDIF